MSKRKIEFEPGEFYHVYNRGCGRQEIFFEQGNYRYFAGLVKRYAELVGVEIGAWCLMPNHFHLLVRPTNDRLASMMQRLGTAYSMAINKQQNRSGTVFEGRFEAKHVDREEYLVHLSRYIHRNPVEAELVNRCGEWDYSSYREFVEEGTIGVSRPEIVLRGGMGREEYREFVEFDSGKSRETIGHLLMD